MDAVDYTCTTCGDAGVLDLEIDHDRLLREDHTARPVAGDHSLWRYRALLPVTPSATCHSRTSGWTPLVRAEGLSVLAGVGEVFVKDDGRNPSASLKDRASAVVVARALDTGRQVVCAASSGNAAAALAAAVAGTPLSAVVFVPAGVPRGKLAQLWAYGARVVLAGGGYGQAVEASRLASTQRGWYCRNTAYNPFTAVGKMTVALEIAEQLGGLAPDVVLVPTGDGNILAAVHRGFADATAMGWLDRVPRLVAVQARGADALHRAWVAGLAAPVTGPENSRADSINVALPQDGARALRAVRATGGGIVTVPDDELARGARTLATHSGVFAEPAAATVVPGLLIAREEGLVTASDRVVLLSTGHGLKDSGLVAEEMGDHDELDRLTPLDVQVSAL
ncbi:threonine synthase [Lentzea fradiae]|uniref:threonine synthase n=1 Tax=Lentzea fradiae TaxID=200378 RepID=UPI0015A0176E|nr:pyridoxal-phosphate dependent enzyme [Lentzea fradiae]